MVLKQQYGSVKYGASGAGLGITNFANDDLRWEKVATTDVGFELGLFKNRISAEFSWYNKKTTDMLLACADTIAFRNNFYFGEYWRNGKQGY